jgi:Fic family protein
MHALGRLDAIGALLPDPALFLYMYVRKEAVLSSQIEGTQSSLSDLLLHEVDPERGTPPADVTETSSYVRALDHGIDQIRRADGLPLCGRLLREMHAILLERGRGEHRQPGELRRSQNWIGGTRPGDAAFVPPPWEQVEDALADLERYLHGPEQPLIKAAVAHAQFETIHPFLDGNGRIGRQLITIVLCAEGILREPLLYLSLYLKEHRGAYYEHLMAVRHDGAWEAWIDFFLDGVIATAAAAASTTAEIRDLIERDRGRIVTSGAMATKLRVFEELVRRAVVIDVPALARSYAVSAQTVYTAIRSLEDLGIAEEVSGQRRHRVWLYREYVTKLAAGTEPLPATG